MVRVVVAEDQTDIREMLREVLADRTKEFEECAPDRVFEALVFDSAAQALAEFERAPVQILLTDIAMPGMTGWQLVEAVQSRGFTGAVIIMTGYTALGENPIPGCTYLNKPFRLSDLCIALKNAMKGTGAIRPGMPVVPVVKHVSN